MTSYKINIDSEYPFSTNALINLQKYLLWLLPNSLVNHTGIGVSSLEGEYSATYKFEVMTHG